MFHCGCVPQPVNRAHGERLLRFTQRVKRQMKDDGSLCAQRNQCSRSLRSSCELIPGNLAERWTDFEPKGGKSARMLGIGGSSPGKAAPDAASSIDPLEIGPP